MNFDEAMVEYILNERAQQAIDDTQQNGKCCGSEGPMSWLDVPWTLKDIKIKSKNPNNRNF